MTLSRPEDFNAYREAEPRARVIVRAVDSIERMLLNMQGGTAAAALREAFAAMPAQMGEAFRAAAQRPAGEQIGCDRESDDSAELRLRVQPVANRLWLYCRDRPPAVHRKRLRAVVERWELYQRSPDCARRWSRSARTAA